MGLMKMFARGAVALSIGVLPFALDTGVAGAVEEYDQSANFDHTFTDEGGQTVTCPVSFSSSLFRESSNDPFFATAFTATSSEDECDAFVSVSTTYVDSAGRRKNPFANSIEGDVFMGVDDVASGYLVNHEVFFLHCSANCDVTHQTKPK